MTNKKAQSILEYVLLLTVALVVMVAAIAAPTGAVNKGLTDFFSKLGVKIGGIVTRVGG